MGAFDVPFTEPPLIQSGQRVLRLAASVRARGLRGLVRAVAAGTCAVGHASPIPQILVVGIIAGIIMVALPVTRESSPGLFIFIIGLSLCGIFGVRTRSDVLLNAFWCCSALGACWCVRATSCRAA